MRPRAGRRARGHHRPYGQERLKQEPLCPPGFKIEWAGEGEWQITLRVFRDLGLAFGAALIGIYILLVVQLQTAFVFHAAVVDGGHPAHHAGHHAGLLAAEQCV